jgi:hypothetical protein
MPRWQLTDDEWEALLAYLNAQREISHPPDSGDAHQAVIPSAARDLSPFPLQLAQIRQAPHAATKPVDFNKRDSSLRLGMAVGTVTGTLPRRAGLLTHAAGSGSPMTGSRR